MSETQQVFDCKEPECDAKVIYEPMSVTVYRGRTQSQNVPGAAGAGIKRVRLRCSRNHQHDYAVRA
jgi:hypothetical protein